MAHAAMLPLCCREPSGTSNVLVGHRLYHKADFGELSRAAAWLRALHMLRSYRPSLANKNDVPLRLAFRHL